MKNTFLAVMLLCTFFWSNAQDTTEANTKQENFNEIKLNGLYLVLGAVELTYERTLSEESAIGASVFLPFDEDIYDEIDFYFSPYYRLYFGKKYAAGFFIEGFGLLSSINRTVTIVETFSFDQLISESDENITDFALGIGLGGKWITKSGFLGELNLGVGRNLFNADDFGNDVVGKVGITIGYRF